jgi:hypothetical protein
MEAVNGAERQVLHIEPRPDTPEDETDRLINNLVFSRRRVDAAARETELDSASSNDEELEPSPLSRVKATLEIRKESGKKPVLLSCQPNWSANQSEYVIERRFRRGVI